MPFRLIATVKAKVLKSNASLSGTLFSAWIANWYVNCSPQRSLWVVTIITCRSVHHIQHRNEKIYGFLNFVSLLTSLKKNNITHLSYTVCKHLGRTDHSMLSAIVWNKTYIRLLFIFSLRVFSYKHPNNVSVFARFAIQIKREHFPTLCRIISKYIFSSQSIMLKRLHTKEHVRL